MHNLSDAKVGDEYMVSLGNYFKNRFVKVKVTKVTATQVTVDLEGKPTRYAKEGGRRIGQEKWSTHATHLQPVNEATIAEHERDHKTRQRCGFLSGFNYKTLTDDQVGQLYTLVKGFEQP